MQPNEIFQYCLENLEGTVLGKNWGERGIFYNPDNVLKCGVYVLTIKEKDGSNDKSSNCNREGVFRVNLGIKKNTFKEMFGFIPKRPSAGNIVDMDYNFTALDEIIPHPVYSWMAWISVLNPSKDTFEELKPLIQESYNYAKEKYKKRKVSSSSKQDK